MPAVPRRKHIIDPNSDVSVVIKKNLECSVLANLINSNVDQCHPKDIAMLINHFNSSNLTNSIVFKIN